MTSPRATARSSELLGYPADARLLIVNNDDFGMYDAINSAVVDTIESGISTSCSLMPPCPGAPDAMATLRDRPHIPFGVHLTLICDLPTFRWGPLTARSEVPSLLDDSGELFAPDAVPALLRRARLDEVEREFRAQIALVLDAGIEPTHLDWHCLADGGRADILELTLALGAEFGLAVRVWLDPTRAALRERGLPVTDNDFLDSFSLDLDRKSELYAQRLRALPAGLNEWAVHPSLGTDEFRALDGGWRVRRSDYEFLMSPQAKQLVGELGVTVLDYRSVQQLWAAG